MARFVFNPFVNLHINALENKGASLNSEHSDVEAGDIEGIGTVKKYIQQDKDIVNLLNSYATLIEKDASDLRGMGSNISSIDIDIANLYKQKG